jgi:hypothetical protein
VSVLTERDRHVVAAAIVRAREPRRRMSRTQALRPHTARPVRGEDATAGVADRAPATTPFTGLCVYCGSPTRGPVACSAHEDLIDLDTNIEGTRRSTCPGSAAGASQETS